MSKHIIELFPFPTFIIKKDNFKIVLFNDKGLSLTQLEEMFLLGMDFQDFIDPNFIKIGEHENCIFKINQQLFSNGNLSVKVFEKDFLIVSFWICDVKIEESVNIRRRNTEGKYRNIIDFAPVGFYQASREGDFILVNNEFARITGFKCTDELIDRNISELYYSKSDRESLIKKYDKGVKSDVRNVEVRFRKQDGSLIWILMTARAIKNKRLETISYDGFITDITKNKKKEEELLLKDHALSSSRNGLGIANLNGNLVYVNDSLVKLWGYTRQELLGRSLMDFWEGDGIHKTMNELKEKGSCFGEDMGKRKDGTFFHYQYTATMVNDSSGSPVNIFGSFVDITKRNKREKRDQILLNLSKKSFDNIDVKSYLEEVRKELQYIMNVDNFYVALYDKKTEKYVFPIHIDEFEDYSTDLPVRLDNTLTDYIRKTAKGAIITASIEEELCRKNEINMVGTPSPVWLGVPLFNSTSSEVVGVIGIQDYHDENAYLKEDLQTLEILASNIGLFVERVRILESLKLAKTAAEESDKLKSAFLTNMSHEIRTPMNGILGFTDLLSEPDLNSEKRDAYIEIIHQSGQRMMNTINDIVEVSKIESGIVVIQKSKFDLNQSIAHIINLFLYEAQEKGLELQFENQISDEYSKIFSDKKKFEGVLINLIKNAIKFTKVGKITVNYKIRNELIEFCIKDTGIGIPENRLESVFKRFEQVDNSLTRGFDGSGLGLAIAKSYLGMMGGKVWVKSIEGEGSEFYFTIPRQDESQN
ncbi:MAG: PAS domain S-box protein [Labilibaculum antarcticum]